MGTELDFQAAKEWLAENEAPENVVAAFEQSKLRGKIEEQATEIKRLQPFESRVQKMELQPKLEEAFSEAGFDVSKLTKAQKKLLGDFTFEGDGPKEEDIKSFAEEWEFPLTEGATQAQTPGTTETVPASGRIAKTAMAATGSVPEGKTLQDQIAHAESEGNFQLAMSLKSQLLTATPS